MIGFCVLLVLAVTCSMLAGDLYYQTIERQEVTYREQLVMTTLWVISAVMVAGAFTCLYLAEIIHQQKRAMKRHCGCGSGSTCNPARPVGPPPDDMKQ